MKPHLIYARHYWQRVVQPGDTVIDATIGNGHDTFFLAHLLHGKGALIGYDIQLQAIEQTTKRLEGLPSSLNQIITLKKQSHIQFEERNIKLIVYNLGYLPGGNKSITTKCAITLQSIQNGLASLSLNGAISITCYPGHEEGAREQATIIDFLKTLPTEKWEICHHIWLKACSQTSNCFLSPSLIWLQSLHNA
jgi:hypothetical protein